MKVTFITSNTAKVELAKQRLSKYGIDVVQKNLDLSECRSLDVEEVALDKANQALKKSTQPFLVEDSAFYIKSLNGFPGTFINSTFDTLGERKITDLVKNEANKKAIIKSVLIFGDPKTKKLKLFTGIYEGYIAEKPKGVNKRGWKVVRIFIPKNGSKTLGQLNDAEWQGFLEDFRKNDHFDQFGRWFMKLID